MLTTGHVTDPVLETIGDNETELQVTVTMMTALDEIQNVECRILTGALSVRTRV